VIIQLDPPLEMITPLGEAEAHFLESEGDRVFFGVFQKVSGENWWFENHLIRLAPCLTSGRPEVSTITLSTMMKSALAEHLKRHR